MDEEILHGGNISTVVRVGGTVRRELKPSSHAVHDLLAHLEKMGFEGSPRFLGIDEQGREILSYIEGQVGCAPYPLPAFMWTRDALVAAGRLLRKYHDAIASFVPRERAEWIYSRGRPGEGQLVCHNDIAPYNTVFADQLPVAFIDWDLAGPTDPLDDIAHAAIYFIPIGPESAAESAGVTEPSKWRGRLRAFCDAYGLDNRERVIPALLRRQRATIDGFLRHAREGDPRFVRMIEDGHLDAHRANLEWLEGHVSDFATELR